ncbi:MAG: PPC domain-containing protein [Desulfobacterales bacterium]|nr:PPC domain-containing protein [Desulfobacterales bacterium]
MLHETIPDSIKTNEIKTYQIFVPEGTSTLKLELADITGEVDMFTQSLSIPNANDGDFICQSSNIDNTKELCVHTYPQAGVWYISVYGYSDSTYTITAKASALEQITTLNVNESIQDSVLMYENKLYKISLSESIPALEIQLNDVAGDPDLYIQYGEIPLIDQGNYICSSTAGENISESCSQSYVESGDWYISVYAYSDATYTITAKILEDKIIPILQENTNVNDTISEGEQKRYILNVPSGVSLVNLKLTNVTGDPDLYLYSSSGDVITASTQNENNPEISQRVILIKGYT